MIKNQLNHIDSFALTALAAKNIPKIAETTYRIRKIETATDSVGDRIKETATVIKKKIRIAAYEANDK
jgi:3-hydroxy-3-methylglutaryl CoA synthase